MNAAELLKDTTVFAGKQDAFAPSPQRALSPESLELLSSVSAKLMASKEAKAFPDVMSFAFWCRRAHLRSLAEGRADLAQSLGRGLALHIAPSNVPVNFAFSWAFSLLAGNANIVRVPSKAFPQVDVLCKVIDKTLEESADSRNLFVGYPSSSNTTELLSAVSDARLIWGGNTTVASVRAMPSKPRCIDVAFADRYSVAVLDAQKVADLDDAGIERLAEGFYNDTYLMDQNACSSPMTVVWLNSCNAGKRRFWEAVRGAAEARYQLQGAIATDKYVQLCRDIVGGRITEPTCFDGLTQVVRMDCSQIEDGTLSKYRGKGGYFYELEAIAPADILRLLDGSCQTVTYFGTDCEMIRQAVIEAGCFGVDRIVPVGKAMDIDIVWDGMDLLSALSRRVDVR